MSLQMSSSSSNKRIRITACSFVGPPPKVLTDKKTLRFGFRNFQNLKQKNGECLESKDLEAHGHLWYAELYRCGYRRDSDRYVSFFLYCKDSSENNQVEAKVAFNFPAPITPETFEHAFDGNGYGFDTLKKRSYVVANGLDSEGSFIVDVDIQIYVEKKSVWYPNKTKMNYADKSKSLGQKLLESKFESDITFVIGRDAHQKEFSAHRIVLFHQAPGLFDFIKDLKRGEVFEIPDANPCTFKILLEYIYNGDFPEDIFNKNGDDNDDDDDNDDAIFDDAKDLLVSASRFGLVDLKLFIESEITSKLLKVENAAEWLPIADSHICPLLKEECMNIFLKDKVQFKSSSGWKNIKESSDLLEELLFYTDDGGASDTNCNDKAGDDDDVDYETMSVGMLREKLESNDLDVDGTKKMLIKRMKDFSTKQKSKSMKTKSKSD